MEGESSGSEYSEAVLAAGREATDAPWQLACVLRAAVASFVCPLCSGIAAALLLGAGLIYPSGQVWTVLTRVWARLMLMITGARLQVDGIEHLRKGQPAFYVGNHQSALDIPIIISATGGDVRFLAKRSLFQIPVFGWALWRYGSVSMDRSDARSASRAVDRMLDRLRRHPVSLVLFPEGTRSGDGRLLPFRRGAMKICCRAGLPVVPFSIDGSHRVNPRHRFRIAPGPVRLTFGRPLSSEQVTGMSATELHDYVRGVIAQQLRQPAALEARVSAAG